MRGEQGRRVRGMCALEAVEREASSTAGPLFLGPCPGMGSGVSTVSTGPCVRPKREFPHGAAGV